jgi:hypothetical protein
MTENTDTRKPSRLRGFLKYTGLTVLFCAILLALFTAVGSVLMPRNSTEAGRTESRAYGFVSEPENTIDVLFMGDSLASTAFFPMRIWSNSGITSYVCSGNGEQISYALGMLGTFLDCQSPKVVFLETQMLYNKFDAGLAVKQVVKDFLPIIEYHQRWKQLTLDDLLGTDDGSDHVSCLKGSNPKALYQAADTSNYMTASDEVERPGTLNVMVLKMLVQMCEEKGVKFVLVSTPQVQDWSYARHNGCAQVAEELGIDFIDMNTDPVSSEVGIDWSLDSRDAGMHLNYRGADKVSDWMASYLSQNYGLADHRSDESYSQWNDCLEQYTEYMAKVAKDPEEYDVPGKHMY